MADDAPEVPFAQVVLDEVAERWPELGAHPEAVAGAIRHVVERTFDEAQVFVLGRAIKHLEDLWTGIEGRRVSKKVASAVRERPETVYLAAADSVRLVTLRVLAGLASLDREPVEDDLGAPRGEA